MSKKVKFVFYSSLFIALALTGIILIVINR
jgi:hypothetical protein